MANTPIPSAVPSPLSTDNLPGRSRLDREVNAVAAAWADGTMAVSTQARMRTLLDRFAGRLAATGVNSMLAATPVDCDAFLWAPTRRNAPPSVHTVHLRRTALRNTYRALRDLDPDIVDPTRELDLPAKVGRRARPLTDGEITLVRIAALGRHRQPMRAAATIALAESTATTGEIPQIVWNDLDLDAGIVRLPGAVPVRPRAGRLTDWAIEILGRWQTDTGAPLGGLVIARRAGLPESHAAQAATANRITKLLAGAGLVGPTVRPHSIRLWAATRVLTAEGIEAAARALGVESLDAAAGALGHRWQVSR